MGVCQSAPKAPEEPIEVHGDIYNSDTRCVLTILESGEADFKFKETTIKNN